MKKATFLSKKYYSMLLGGTLTAVLTSAVAMSDMMIAGAFIGEAAVTGVNLVLPIYSVSNFFVWMFSIGVPIIYSNAMGAFQKEEADRIFGTGILLSVISGIILFLVLVFGGDFFLEHLHPGEEAMFHAKEYLFWIKYAILFLTLNSLMSGMVFADGGERISTVSNLAEGVGNVVLSMLLCRVMGTRGIGLGTFISTVLCLVLLIPHFLSPRNSLRLNFDFSFPVVREIVRFGIVDASNYLFMGLFVLGMTHFVTGVFGPEALIFVTVATLIKEAQLLFDGTGEAITPIVEVYLGEETYPGIRKIWDLALKTTFFESAILTVVILAAAPSIIRLLGIESAEFFDISVLGLRMMAVTLFFTCRMYLDSSYYILVDKIPLGILVCAFRDVLFPLPMAVLGGMAGGTVGMFAGLMIAPVLAYYCSVLYVSLRYGKKNYVLFLADKDESKSWLYEFEVVPEQIVMLRDEIGEKLRKCGYSAGTVNRTMLLFEELFMLIYDHNPGRKVLAECSVELGDKVRLIAKDDGNMLDLTDTDLEVSSLRSYIVSTLVGNLTEKRVRFVTLSFNRNALEIK